MAVYERKSKAGSVVACRSTVSRWSTQTYSSLGSGVVGGVSPEISVLVRDRGDDPWEQKLLVFGNSVTMGEEGRCRALAKALFL